MRQSKPHPRRDPRRTGLRRLRAGARRQRHRPVRRMARLLPRTGRPARPYRCSDDRHAPRQGIVHGHRLAEQGLLGQDDQLALPLPVLPHAQVAEALPREQRHRAQPRDGAR